MAPLPSRPPGFVLGSGLFGVPGRRAAGGAAEAEGSAAGGDRRVPGRGWEEDGPDLGTRVPDERLVVGWKRLRVNGTSDILCYVLVVAHIAVFAHCAW